MKKIIISLLALFVTVVMFSGCGTDAQVASHNLSKDADMFRINRRVVFYNGITGEYMLSVEGRCSLEVDSYDGQLELTCKTGDGSYKKHFLGLSDNVTYFAEQLEPTAVSAYHYKVIFKPQSIIPDIDLETSIPEPKYK